MRKVRLSRQNVFNNYDHHSSPITLRRTCDARAAVEFHFLHALGEHDLVDLACGREGKERERENEE